MPDTEVLGVIPLLRAAQAHCVCPICTYLFHEPAGLPCGHVFCRACLIRCLQDRHQCPLCNRASSSRRSIIPLPNLALFTSLVRQVVTRAVTEEERGTSPPPAQRARVESEHTATTTPVAAAGALVGTESAAETPPTVASKGSRTGSSFPFEDHSRRGPSRSPASPDTQLALQRKSPLTELSSSQLLNPQVPRLLADFATAAGRDAETQCLLPRAAEGSAPSSLPERYASGHGDGLTPVLSQAAVTEVQQTTVAAPAAGALHGDRASAVLDVLRRHEPGRYSCSLLPSTSVTTTEGATQTPAGCCALCGLDASDRDSVRAFLLSLLNSPTARCEASELAELTEDALEAMLGPLWQVTVATAERQAEGDAADRAAALSVVAHHNCLAWIGVLPREVERCNTKGAFTPSLVSGQAPGTMDSGSGDAFTSGETAGGEMRPALASLANQFLSQCTPAGRAGGRDGKEATDPSSSPSTTTTAAAVCSVCRRADRFTTTVWVSSGASPADTVDKGHALPLDVPPCLGLRACHASAPSPVCSRQRRAFHMPCALLAGADVCLVLGLDTEDAPDEGVEVWCGPCHRKRQKHTA